MDDRNRVASHSWGFLFGGWCVYLSKYFLENIMESKNKSCCDKKCKCCNGECSCNGCEKGKPCNCNCDCACCKVECCCSK